MRSLPVSVQAHLLKQCFPGEKLKVTKRELVWEGSLRPSIISCAYTVKVQYSLMTDLKSTSWPPTFRQLLML
jgi:hypothetical protein